ncbi:LuxR C-terminal-related transcriptional regulator [Streptomyces sp. NPDC001978]|uniref:LuxR C-terminal-related transcriptional regulator n=1 Tax=Streptomyces sp. NPDC001978 TaxID=3364627 RepID=UPI0036C707FC
MGVPVQQGASPTTHNQACRPASSGGLGVLVVDDVCLYREGLASVLARQPGIAKVLTAPDVPTAITAVTTEPPDVILLSLALLGGGQLLSAVRAVRPAPRTIVIGVTEAEEEVIACAEAGVQGYLLRSEPMEHLLRLMRAVAVGETLCTPRMTALLMCRVATLASELRPAPKVPALTVREDQVLGLLELGLSNQEIADRLGIEVRTVKNHVHRILEKAGARRRGEAVAEFRRMGRISSP